MTAPVVAATANADEHGNAWRAVIRLLGGHHVERHLQKSGKWSPPIALYSHVPDREDTASLGQVGLLGDATDALLENGRNLGGRCLGLGVGSGLDVEGGGCGISCLASRSMAS